MRKILIPLRCDESFHLSQKYLKFDLHQLLRKAVETVSAKGAQYCTEVLKCKEGLNNKVYLLKMDNGSEIVAKLPNPCAGPFFYTTASEVATRKFVEYILEEKATGVPLWSLWQDHDKWPMEDRLYIVEKVVDMEEKLLSMKFIKSGCIYLKEDMPHGEALVTDPPMSTSVAERFTLGPMVDIDFWYGERVNMDLNRGPYDSALDFVKAMAKNEIRYIENHPYPRMNYAHSLTRPELPEDTIQLLLQYLELSPAMVPPPSVYELHSPTLRHPDLHLDNIFVDTESKEISCVIDWQWTAMLPLFYQCGMPAMFKDRKLAFNSIPAVPKRPQDYHTLPSEEQKKIDNDIERKCMHIYYLGVSQSRNPQHWTALQFHNELQTQPARIAQSVWRANDVFFLRRALMRIVDVWESLSPDSGPCPVSFTDQVVAQHAHEEENRGHVGEILTLFRDRWGLPPSGMVDSGRFDEIQPELEKMRKTFIEAAGDEDRALAEKLWPYQDTLGD